LEIALLLKLRTILLYDYLYIGLALLGIAFSLITTNYLHHQSCYDKFDSKVEGYIHNQLIDGNKLTIELIGKEKIVINYYFNSLEEKESYNNSLGDCIRVKGVLNEPKPNTVFNLFNYKIYLHHKGIYYVVKAESIKKVKENTRLRYKIKQIISSRINSIEIQKVILEL
jgi:hypothetical protein